MILGDGMAAKVIRTRGAVAYEKEVTCVITISEAHLALFNSAASSSATRGAFMMQQGISGAPRWFKKTAEEGKSEEGHTRYYDRVSKLVADQKARLLYRPHDLSPLGAIGVDGGEDMVELKWFINKAPTQWITADDVIAWITKRGFNKVSEVARIGSRVWTFIGEAPAGVHTTAFEFSSGILVTRGVKIKAKTALQAEAKVAKSRWGGTQGNQSAG